MPLLPGLGAAIADLEKADTVLLLGSNIQKEQPLAALRLRKAYLKGAAFSINPMAYRFHFRVKAKKIVSPAEIVEALAAVAKHLSRSATNVDPKLKQSLEQVKVDESARQLRKF